MKKILASFLAGLACLTASAETSVTNNPFNAPYLGIRVGADVVCPGDMKSDNVSIDMFSNGGGIEFGAVYNIPLVANLYIEPGVNLYYNSYSIKKEWLSLLDNDGDITGVSERRFGFRIPVMLGYRFDLTSDVNVSVFTGPELEIGLSGKEKVKGRMLSLSGDLYGDDGSFNRTNVLWGLGASVGYRHFIFGIKGGIGMANMLSDSDVTMRENRVTFSLGYNF